MSITQNYIQQLEAFVDLVDRLMIPNKELTDKLRKIRETQQETHVVVRQLTYVGNKLEIEKSLDSRSVKGTKDIQTYAITEEFLET